MAATITVNVTNGNPDPDPVPLPDCDETLVFSNHDQTDYFIELRRKGSKYHDPVCIVLPANGTATLIVDPNDCDITCYYQLLDSTGGPVGTIETGHSIIIGSGRATSQRKKKNTKKLRSKKQSKK